MKPEDKEDKSAPKKQPAPNGKVFDVSRPGKAPASPASKPVILGHKPEAQQAQTSVSGIGEAKPIIARRKIQIMPSGDLKPADGGEKSAGDAPESESSKAETKPETAPGETAPQEEQEAIGAAAVDATAGPPELPGGGKMLSKRLTIQPLSTSETPKEEESKPKPEAEEEVPSLADEPGGSEPNTEEAPEATEPESTPAAETEPESAVEKTEEEKADEPAPDSLAEELPKDTSSVPIETGGPDDKAPKPEGAAADEPAPEESDVKIEPLFDESGRIVVSQHNHHKRHGTKVALLFLLIVLLAAAAADILLDLEMLNLEGIPHTDFL